MSTLLAVETLSAGYGAAQVLDAVSLSLREGESLALLGRNGMGKTTLIASIMGLTRRTAGRIAFDGIDLTHLPPERRARAGIGWVPQERNIFRSLTVEENLTCVARPGAFDLAAIYRLFPRLRERRGNMGRQLSGGEQQMLAIGRALVLNPRLLLLDEPTEGLAPIVAAEVLAVVKRLTRESGLSAVIVEQHAQKVLAVTDAAVILERGRVVFDGRSAAVGDDVLGRFLGVG